jgi:Ca2+-binding RTX toxin-like protein
MALIEGDSVPNALAGGDENDVMFGFESDDTLSGAGGDDTLAGGAGNDILRGDHGFDIASYVDASLWVIVTLNVSGPADTSGSGVDTLVSIEGLEGSAHNDALTGSESANRLSGLSGNDVLQGLTGLDTLDGGDGDDIITGGDDDDQLTGGDGEDVLNGDDGDDLITGGRGPDRLGGGDGVDRFVFGFEADGAHSNPLAPDLIADFAGGSSLGGDILDLSAAHPGARRLILLNEQVPFAFSGLAGASGEQLPDEMIGDGFADVVWTLDPATDRARLWVDTDDDGLFGINDQLVHIGFSGGGWALAEHDFAGLTPAISGASAGDALTGTVAADLMLGRGGNDTLSGGEGHDELIGGSGNDMLLGQAGTDTLTGGAGDDIYVDPHGDVVVETSSGGRDVVMSERNFSLAALVEIEGVVLTGSGNTTAVGNARGNSLTGNAGNNTLNGAAGADTMAGGGGNDIYFVDHAGDVTTEVAGQGIDLVSASVSRSLSIHVENLNLSGAANIDGNGNTLANAINGNAGSNVLRGHEGADTLNGGAGNDILLGGTASDALNPGNDAVRDIIRLSAVADSTGSQRDIISGMDLNGEDRLDFPVVPTSLGVVTGGALNLATINADLAAAVNEALSAGGAVVFDPGEGNLNVAGHVFVVVDANGDGVYRPNQDYVVQLVNASGALTLDDFI